MKRTIFNNYVKAVSDRFGITKEQMFEKTKKRELVDARQILYYLCSERPITIGYIQTYMKDAGFPVSHSTIIHGIKRATELVNNDPDLAHMMNNIEEQCA